MKTYSENFIELLAQTALHSACEVIQEELGQTDGGVAGMHFSGQKEDEILSLLKSYIQTEIMFKEKSL
jgi:hypothetical protein